MSLKKVSLICASALMMLSVGATNVSASSKSQTNHSTRISRHLKDTKLITTAKNSHHRNVKQINQIKRHLFNHQRNLIKLSRRINHLRHHRHSRALLHRLNVDKAHLISAIQHNERGMLRLAKRVANDEHQINLVRHHHHNRSAKVTTVKLPNGTDDSVERSVSTVINEVNGKLTKYVAKDSTARRHGNQSSYHQYSNVNGHYSATPNQITQDEIHQLNQQIQNQIQNSNQWFKEMNREINEDF